jgi:hypothetical protein
MVNIKPGRISRPDCVLEYLPVMPAVLLQLDFEAWLRKIHKHTEVIFLQGNFPQCQILLTPALLRVRQTSSVEELIMETQLS